MLKTHPLRRAALIGTCAALLLNAGSCARESSRDGNPADDAATVEVDIAEAPPEIGSVSVALDLGDGLAHSECVLAEPGVGGKVVWENLSGASAAISASAFASDDCSGAVALRSLPLAAPLKVDSTVVFALRFASQAIETLFTSLPGKAGTQASSPDDVYLQAPAKCSSNAQCPLCQVCSQGKCALQAAGRDAKNECAASKCRTGSCDGKGACGTTGNGSTCATGKICKNGSCAVGCSSAATCGRCSQCLAGKCVSGCPAGSSCLSTGACGPVCRPGERLCGSQCLTPDRPCNGMCPPGGKLCNGACIPTSACCNSSECPCGMCVAGSCRIACPPGNMCIANKCTPSCMPPQRSCVDHCVPPDQPCNGQCGPTTQLCRNRCIPLSACCSNMDCKPPTVCQGDRCVMGPPMWTAWFDRDDPTGNGDGEHLSALIMEGAAVCAHPLDVRCRRKSDQVDHRMTGEVVTCTPSAGSICLNADQSDLMCDDYEVQFLCP